MQTVFVFEREATSEEGGNESGAGDENYHSKIIAHFEPFLPIYSYDTMKTTRKSYFAASFYTFYIKKYAKR